MLWVEQQRYIGPDRRQGAGGLRVFERRRRNAATVSPPLGTALRQLRMHILDATGAGAHEFVMRAHGVAALARSLNEPEAASILMNMATVATIGQSRDVRPHLYNMLDEAHAALVGAH